MAEKVTLEISVNAETGQLDVLGAKFQGLTDKATKTQESFLGLEGQSAKLLKTTLGFASAGAIVSFFAKAVKGAEEENESLRRLKGTIESTGQSWEKNARSIDEWSKQIQQATRFSDGQALTVLDKLARSTSNLTQAQKASQLAMDLHVRTGKPLAETTEFINDLINKQARAVNSAHKEYGNLAGSVNTAQGILDSLSANVSGASEQEESLTKTTEQAKNAFGELSDTIGTTFAPAAKLIAEILTVSITAVRGLGTAVAGQVLVMGQAFVDLGKLMATFFSGGKWSDLKAEFNNLVENIRTGIAVTVDDIVAGEEKKTDAIKKAADERLNVNNTANAAEDRDRAESLEKAEAMTLDLEQKMLQLNGKTHENKKRMLENEIAQLQANARATIKIKTDLDKVLDEIDKFAIAKQKALSKENLQIKTDLALDIAGTAIQTLQVLNAIGDSGSHAERIRAKALLALQQSLAIGWAWIAASRYAAETGNPLLAYSLAAAQTALIIAQFAQQSKNIDSSGSKADSELQNINTPNLGSLGGLDQVGPGGVQTGSGSTGGGSGGGSGGGFGGGGGGGNVINVGGIVVNFDVDKLSVDNVEAVMMKMYERVRQGAVEGVQLALALKTSADKNSTLGV